MLATAPDILILDEPTFGQDANTWRELVTLLAEQRDEHGCTVVSVTHDAEFTAALGGGLLQVANGRVSDVPQPEELRTGSETSSGPGRGAGGGAA